MLSLVPFAALALSLQATSPSAKSDPPPGSSATTATAQRATTPPVIDGKDNDEVWQLAQPITEFRQFQPVEDANPRLKTEAKVAYDDRNFYVFVQIGRASCRERV